MVKDSYAPKKKEMVNPNYQLSKEDQRVHQILDKARTKATLLKMMM